MVLGESSFLLTYSIRVWIYGVLRVCLGSRDNIVTIPEIDLNMD